MKFVEPVFDTPEYKIIKQALEASGHGPACYNKTDQYLILDGLYYRTGTYDVFINVNYPELTYEQFVAKYKIKP